MWLFEFNANCAKCLHDLVSGNTCLIVYNLAIKFVLV